jgi:hypothetical protein
MVISFIPKISHNCGKLTIIMCDNRFGGPFQVSKERFPQFQAIRAASVGSKVQIHGKLEYSPHPAGGNLAHGQKT